MRSQGFFSRFHSSSLFVLLIILVLAAGCGTADPAAGDAAGKGPTVPQPRSTADEEDAYCDLTYQELLGRLAEDHIACLQPANAALRDCPKPEGSGDALGGRELNVVIALDSSGSMAGKIGGKSKIDIARKAVDGFVNSLTEATNVGLIVYGHQGDNTEIQKQASCGGVESIYPIGELRKANFLKAVHSFEPRGWTPVAGAIDKARSELAPREGEANMVYVVSDGIETCGGDPVAAARSLHASEAKAIVNIIGFDVDNAAQQQLRAAAEAGGGQYFDAKNAEELGRIFGGVSRSLAQYREYIRCMTANQQDVARIFRNNAARLSNCVFVKVTKESASFRSEVRAWNWSNDPRSRCDTYISRKQNEREQAIKAWRDKLEKDVEERRSIIYDELERELRTVTQGGPPSR